MISLTIVALTRPSLSLSIVREKEKKGTSRNCSGNPFSYFSFVPLIFFYYYLFPIFDHQFPGEIVIDLLLGKWLNDFLLTTKKKRLRRRR